MRMRLTFAVLDAPPRPEPRFSCASAPPLPAPRPGHVSPASLLRRPRPARVPPAPTPRAPPAHLDSPDPALCPAPRAASQSSFSPSCPRLSRGRMFHVKHSSASDPPPSLPLPSLACAACHPASPPALSCGVACPRSRLRYARPRPCPRSVTPASFESFCSCPPLIPTPLRPVAPACLRRVFPVPACLRAARRSEGAVLL